MITKDGYSKDPGIFPEGIVLTLPVQFFEDRGMKYDEFKKYFEKIMSLDHMIWNFKLTNLPLHQVLYVYLLFDGHIQYRLHFVQYERNLSKSFKDGPDNKSRHFINCNWVIFTGPPVKAPEAWPQKGFQGFRYCTKLF